MKSSFSILLLLLLPIVCFSQKTEKRNKSEENIYVIDRVEFKQHISNEAITILDVRTKREYDAGHINKAININVRNRRSFKKRVERLNKLEPIYVYCYSGVRSHSASRILKKKGFKIIYDFKFGWKTWSKN